MSFNPNAPQNRGASAAPTSDGAITRNPGTRITLSKAVGYTDPKVLAQPFVFPAPPLDALTRNLAHNFQDYDTVSAGQFSRSAGMALETVSFDTIITADEYPWQFYNPMGRYGWQIEDVNSLLEELLHTGTPFNFAVQDAEYQYDSSAGAIGVTADFGPTSVIRMMATLRTYVPTKKAGEPDAIYITCGFTEYRKPGITQRKLGKGGSGKGSSGKGGENSRTLPTTVALASITAATKNNTLQDLAVAHYGSASKWTFIRAANPWLGNVTATQDLSNHSTAALKTAANQNKKITIPAIAGGG